MLIFSFIILFWANTRFTCFNAQRDISVFSYSPALQNRIPSVQNAQFLTFKTFYMHENLYETLN